MIEIYLLNFVSLDIVIFEKSAFYWLLHKLNNIVMESFTVLL